MKFLLPILLAALSFGQTPPVLIQPGNVSVFYHSTDGNQGPFEWNGAAYIFGYRINAVSRSFDIVTFYKTIDAGVTWVEQDVADSPTVGDLGKASVFYPKAGGSVLYIAWHDPPSAFVASDLRISSFDMSTDTWSAIATGGPNILRMQGEPGLLVVRLSDGSFVLQYQATDGSQNQSWYVKYSGSWGSPVLVGTGYMDGTASATALIGVTSSDTVLMLWYSINSGVASTVYANTLSGSTLSSLINVYDVAGGGNIWKIGDWDELSGWNCHGEYLSTLNKIAWAVTFRPSNSQNDTKLLIADTSVGTPTFSFVAVASSSGIGNTTQNWADLVVNDAESEFTVAWNFSDNAFGDTAEVLTSTASSPTGTWSAPAIFYNEVTTPPTPTPPYIEVNSLSARLLSGGLSLALGMASHQNSRDWFQSQFGMVFLGAPTHKVRHRASPN